uniref:Prolyl 4-hydroxylase alpha subunit domain-containing protein n=1 Tax=Strigamia maritima TaxID=126957 RepID=T1ILC0_STRMM
MDAAHASNCRTMRMCEVLCTLRMCRAFHNKALESEENLKHSFEQPITSQSPVEIKNLKISKKTKQKHKLGLELSKDEKITNYFALCGGEQLRNSSEEANLNCYLSNRGDASFYINPIKVEVHSHDPLIVSFHDIIYESEINLIKWYSQFSLERSKVIGNSAVLSDARTSQNTWLDDNVEDAKLRHKLKIIMDRVSRITRLNVHGKKNSETMQVANYGIGGHYSPHVDYFLETPNRKKSDEKTSMDMKSKNRLATFMFYLNDVKRGGATVFPLIGAAVWPRKVNINATKWGSAAFWYNILRNKWIYDQ